MITRRGFLSGLAAALVAPLPERRRVYSFPSVTVFKPRALGPTTFESDQLVDWDEVAASVQVPKALLLGVDREWPNVVSIPDAETARRLLGWDMREFFARQAQPIVFPIPE